MTAVTNGTMLKVKKSQSLFNAVKNEVFNKHALKTRNQKSIDQFCMDYDSFEELDSYNNSFNQLHNIQNCQLSGEVFTKH